MASQPGVRGFLRKAVVDEYCEGYMAVNGRLVLTLQKQVGDGSWITQTRPLISWKEMYSWPPNGGRWEVDKFVMYECMWLN